LNKENRVNLELFELNKEQRRADNISFTDKYFSTAESSFTRIPKPFDERFLNLRGQL